MIKKYTVGEFLLTYTSWQSMLQRCVYRGKSRKDTEFYSNVQVHPSWLHFSKFISDMGARPGKEFTLDRYPDKGGHYAPGNCRWATARQQAANTKRAKLLTFRNETLPVAEWARRTGLARSTIQNRLYAGWSVDDALTAIAGSSKHYLTDFASGRASGKKLSVAQVAEIVSQGKAGGVTAVGLSARYGVTDAAIGHVLRQHDVYLRKGRPSK